MPTAEYNHCMAVNQAILLRANFTLRRKLMAKPTIVQVLKSVLAAFAGIQSGKNRALDFTEGKVSHYIVAGLVVIVAFIFTLVFIVSAVIGS